MASVTPPGLAYEVEHDQVNHRFTARVRGQVALLDYQIKRRRMVITHTEVPEPIAGRGIAGTRDPRHQLHLGEAGDLQLRHHRVAVAQLGLEELDHQVLPLLPDVNAELVVRQLDDHLARRAGSSPEVNVFE